MSVLVEFLEILLSFCSLPFIAVIAMLWSLFENPPVLGAIVCIIVSALYALLCSIISHLGWERSDQCPRWTAYTLRPGWSFIHFISKAFLTMVHAAVYVTIWCGRTTGLRESPFSVWALVIGMIVTLATLLVTPLSTSGSGTHYENN